MRIYLDVCCLNRPFDDRSQERVRLESEAVLSILQRVEAGTLSSVRSIVHDEEIAQIKDGFRRAGVEMLAGMLVVQPYDAAVERRSLELVDLGFHVADARHLAYAEASCEVILTTDDRMERLARRLAELLVVPVRNPVSWFLEFMER